MQKCAGSSEILSATGDAKLYTCPLCDQIFTEPPLLEYHFNKEHEAEVISTVLKSNLKL